ncbi:MAG TPA: hypothetical protein VGL60_08505 [Acidimicrobiales bacterium]
MQRAGATGGGRTYRGQIPVNWYAAVVLIVVVGLVSIVYSRSEYRRPNTAVAPTKGTTWYAGISFDICGKQEAALPAKSSTTGISTSGNGVIVISPTTAAQAGNHATLGRFVAGYKGLQISADALQYPGMARLANGDTCPSGTPDAGKKGSVVIESWPNVEAKTSTRVTGDPADFKIPQTSLIGVGFVPSGTKLQKSASVEVAVLQAAAAAESATTTTTAPGSTTTTTAPGSTTTAPGSTTPTTAGSTTTTAK